MLPVDEKIQNLPADIDVTNSPTNSPTQISESNADALTVTIWGQLSTYKNQRGICRKGRKQEMLESTTTRK